jgi:hypothetical protein
MIDVWNEEHRHEGESIDDFMSRCWVIGRATANLNLRG